MTRRRAASPPGRYSSPRSPEQFDSYDCDDFDANSAIGNTSAISSIYGNASAFGSVVGHDDPTAIMGNVRRSFDDSTVLPTSSTMDSMINDTRDPDDIGRARAQTPGFDEDEELRDQLSELDRTEDEWKSTMSLHSTRNDDIMADTLMSDTYSSRRSKMSRRSGDRIGDAGEFYRDDDRTPTSPYERGRRSGTGNSSDRSGRSNTSGRSSTLDRANASALADESMDSMEEGSGHKPPKKPCAKHRETDEIVRQVQKRLTGGRHDLASKTDISTDVSSDDDEKSTTGTRTWRILLIVILLIVLGATAAILYFWKIKDDALPASKDTLDPQNDAGDKGPLDEPLDDLVAASPSPSSMKATQAPTTIVTNPTLMPSEQRLGDSFFHLSGDAVYNPSTPQFEAIRWLEHDDLLSLNLDTLPEQTVHERYIATLLYFSMNGSNWDKSYGFLGQESVCEWQDETNGKGIVCSGNGTIEAILINENNLYGSLPLELKYLTRLKKLELRGNTIHGQIPEQFGDMSSLEEVDLRENQLHGTIPAGLFSLTKLRKLFLLRNSELGGSIPSSIDIATNLEMMSFQRCQLTGSLPETLGALTKLHFFTTLGNELTGTIPEGLTQLPRLEVLELSGNLFDGSIPNFARQPSLYFISLDDNLLSGTIPSTLGSLPGILFLDIRDNRLGGTIPPEIGSLPFLVSFYASNNQLVGSLPPFNGNRGMLQAIGIDNNQLSGSLNSFFNADGPTARLRSLEFDSNGFSGTIPDDISLFTSLNAVVFDFNDFEGSIPTQIGSMSMLEILAVKQNQLRGTLPEELGFLDNLVLMDLGGNSLMGTIPDTFSLLSSLAVLDLSSNQLTGEVHSVLGSLGDLDALRLNHNDLTGDLDPIFCARNLNSHPIVSFLADCGGANPEVICTCCSSCCSDDGGCTPS